MIITTIQSIPALGGKYWTIATCSEVPTGFTTWHSLSSKGYRTANLAIGFIKRYAKNNGGDAAWAVVNDSINGNPAWMVYIGTSAAMQQAATYARTVTKPAREFLQAIRENKI